MVFRSWELFISFDFDWQYISGKKVFRWPLVSMPLHPEGDTLKRCLADLLFLEPVFPLILTHWNVSPALYHTIAMTDAMPHQ